MAKGLLLLLFLTLYACGMGTGGGSLAPELQEEALNLELLFKRNDVIWGFDFLPDRRIIFTERSGHMHLFDPTTSAVTEISGVPSVFAVGEGGLLDVRAHPEFQTNPFVYFCYADPMGGSAATTSLARARLEGNALTAFQKLLAAASANTNTIHFGCRIEFDRKGHVFFSVGERNNRERAQDLSFHQGKIMRLNEDGTVPADNPFVNTAGARPEIFSLGLRNCEGLALHPQTGLLWASELGPVGGDEINIIKAGANYGWPLVSYGTDPGGVPIGVGTTRAGIEDALAFWVPSISPSGIGFYFGDKIPEWRGNLFMANLSGQHLRRLIVTETTVTGQQELFKDLGWRFRNVRQGPDGYLYFSTDEGRLVRIVPK